MMQEQITVAFPDGSERAPDRTYQHTYVLADITCPACMMGLEGREPEGSPHAGLPSFEQAVYREPEPSSDEGFEGLYWHICLGCGYVFYGPLEDDDDMRNLPLADMILAALGRARV